jgi:shikimate dehydrogenase
MYPHDNEEPWVPEGLLESRPCVYDLIYAPEETLLLKRAREARCPTLNGLGMLVQQGAISLALWSGIPLEELPVVQMERAARYMMW